MSKVIDHQLILSLRLEGEPVKSIARAAECSERSVTTVLSKNNVRVGQQPFTVSRERLLELWESRLTMFDIGKRLGCHESTVSRLVREHAMPAREPLRHTPDDIVSPEEEMASSESLALSPWVQARIRELRLGMPA